jgi:WhiB family transcriptional regulator, redox-sensing transcriptional regulator
VSGRPATRPPLRPPARPPRRPTGVANPGEPAPPAVSRAELRDWTWRLDAACGGLPSSVFYSPEGERGMARRRRERAAKAICAGCRVREQCAAYALTFHERYGVWGGLSEHERELLWNRQGGKAT